MKRFIAFVLLLLGPISLMASSIDTHTIPVLDLARYMGRWYVIANIPYFLENGKVASYDSYALQADGTLTNNFTFRKDSLNEPEKTWHGHAEVVNKVSNAEWKVRFIWPFSATYLVLELDPLYNWSLVGTPNGKLLWVLSRTRHLPTSTYDSIVARARARGYDTTKLALVPQPDE